MSTPSSGISAHAPLAIANAYTALEAGATHIDTCTFSRLLNRESS